MINARLSDKTSEVSSLMALHQAIKMGLYLVDPMDRSLPRGKRNKVPKCESFEAFEAHIP